MIDAKEAVEISRKYISDLTGRFITDFSVEEVELSEDDDGNEYWYVTLGYVKNDYTGAKEYKIFKIDAETKEVESMKIRDI